MALSAGDSPEELPDINFLGFNQDQTCLAVGTVAGFRIFSTENFTLLHKEDCGAVSVVEMLFSTSLLALVGFSSSKTLSSSSRKLTMWNTQTRKSMCSLGFETKIFNVKMNTRRVVVLLQQKIHIFDLKNMPRQLHVIDRAASPWADPALGWLCAASERGFLATPLALADAAGAATGAQTSVWSSGAHLADAARGLGLKGTTSAEPGGENSGASDALGLVAVVDTYTLKPVGTALAHRMPVQALCMNPSGQMLATASTKGTVIRVFTVPALEMVYAFRRGTSTCRLFALLFSRDSGHLCASSAGGTVHIFKNSDAVLAGLPLQSEAATVGAAHRDLAVQVQGPGSEGAPAAVKTKDAAQLPAAKAPPVQPGGLLTLGPRPGLAAASGDALAAAAGGCGDEEVLDDADLEGWSLVEESPERLLEMNLNGPSYCSGGSSGSRSNALQALTEVGGQVVQNLPRYMELARENSEKYARQLVAMLPQPCRELVDAPRAFAWAHLRGAEREDGGGGLAEKAQACLADTAGGTVAAVGAELIQGLSHFASSWPEHGGFISCVNLHPRGSPGRAEVLVATVHGCAHVYEWSASVGGECRLRTEYSFMGSVQGERQGGGVAPSSRPA